MRARRIRLADHRERDAVVLLVSANGKSTRRYSDGDGNSVRSKRLIKCTEQTNHDALTARFADTDKLAQAMIDGDPEIDIEAVGRETGPSGRVYLDGAGSPLYTPSFVEIVSSPDGKEMIRRPAADTPANIGPHIPAAWSNKLVPIDEAVRRYAFTRACQVRHTDGLTYDFLFELARYLDDHKSMVVVGSGRKGTGPLILERNGTPLKGLLEARTKGDAYLLILHLATFELRLPEPAR